MNLVLESCLWFGRNVVRDEELDCCVARGRGLGLVCCSLHRVGGGGKGTAIMIAFVLGLLLERSWE